jgi:hypothetical protein
MRGYVIARRVLHLLALILAVCVLRTDGIVEAWGPPSPRVITSGDVDRPDAADIVNDPMVKAAIDQAYEDSLAADLEARHEEGGWIIESMSTGALRVERCAGGPSGDMFMEVCDANLGPDEHAAAFFHTHPGPETDENGNHWQNDPSTEDRDALSGDQFGVVRTDNNYIIFDGTYDSNPTPTPTPTPTQ